ncbi:N-acetylneuraminate synthase [Silvanigrella sp.]|jgi:N,N'-diacetyllegionaminate synthase|uniref:N-acetylneuraminate synthase n=1 Tax=Silvanigrella sp. TaxID=2024976 RepID=UPI0037C7A6A6
MKKTIIIAEAGVNHNGDLELAKRLIEVAANAGADYVKFQTFTANELVTQNATRADYQIKNSNIDETHFEMIRRLELKRENHQVLINHSKNCGINFLSTAFDIQSLDFLFSLGIDLFKIPSGEITNYPYLKAVASYKKKIILSTGMSTLADVDNAISVLLKYGAKREDITILHCTTEYPAPINEVNLLAMNTLKTAFGIKVGYSDHTMGIEIPIAAVALGACLIEKHFTLDRKMIGPDHKASLEPEELKLMISSIRSVELALGDGIKQVSSSELKNINIARKSLVANLKISKGDVFTKDNLGIKRPGNGISPMRYEEVLGKLACRDFDTDELIDF